MNIHKQKILFLRIYAVDIPLMCLYWPSIIIYYLYTEQRNIVTGLWISGRELPGWMNCNLLVITSMAVSEYDSDSALKCQHRHSKAKSCFMNVQLIIHRLVIVVLYFRIRSSLGPFAVIEQPRWVVDVLWAEGRPMHY